MFKSCGKVMGHGLSCQSDYLCDQCAYIKELEAKLAAVKEVESYSIELQDMGRPATVMLTKDVLLAIGELV